MSGLFTVSRNVMGKALAFAGLPWDNVLVGSHPDEGGDCLYLLADIREWSSFLVGVALQPTAGGEAFLLAQNVMKEEDGGLTRFWLQEASIPGF